MQITPKLSHSLEAVRGIAALVVLVAHTMQWFVAPLLSFEHPIFKVAIFLAHYSVLIFFALSGFLITNSLYQNYRHNGVILGGPYVRSRLVRIVPPGLAAIIFSCAVSALIVVTGMHGSDSFSLEHDVSLGREHARLEALNILATLFFSNGILPGTKAIYTNGSLWSLSLEFWAYFIALAGAVVVVGLTGKKPVQRNSAASTLPVLLMILLFLAWQPVSLFQYFFYWFIGSLLYLLYLGKKFAGVSIAAIVVSGLVVASYLLYNNISLGIVVGGPVGGWVMLMKGTILIIVTPLIFVIPKIPFQRLFRNLAKSSYTLYVFHFPMLCLMFSVFHEGFMAWGALNRAFFLMILISGITLICHYFATYLEDKNRWDAILGSLISRLGGSKGSFVSKSFIR